MPTHNYISNKRIPITELPDYRLPFSAYLCQLIHYDMVYVKSFRDLEVYRLAREVSKEIFILSKKFPSDEKYSLTDQIRRSSRSVGAQIAEAWDKRKYQLHFVSKLTDADSEQLETQHWLEISYECHYIDASTSEQIMKKCESIGKMIQSMIEKSSTFCKK